MNKNSAGVGPGLVFLGVSMILFFVFCMPFLAKSIKAETVAKADYDYDAICANYDAYWEEPSEIPMTDEFPSEDEIITWSFDEVETFVKGHYDLIEEYSIQWNRLGHIWNYVNDRETYEFDEEDYIAALNGEE